MSDEARHYVIRYNGKDAKWGIYSSPHNVRLAIFTRGVSERTRNRIGELLAASDDSKETR